MRFVRYALTLMAFMLSYQAHAQYGSMWGTGLYGGLQSCNYGYKMSENAKSIKDDIDELNKQVKEKKKDLRPFEKDLKDAKRQLDDYARGLDPLTGKFKSWVIDHSKTTERNCSDYAADGPAATTVKGIDPQKVEAYCPQGGNKLVATMCLNEISFASDERRKKCQDAVNNYGEQYAKVQQLQKEVDARKKEIKDLEKYATRYKDDLKETIKQDIEDAQQEAMEGGPCIECLTSGGGGGPYYVREEPSTGQIIGNLLMGAAGLGAGVYLQSKAISTNAKLGMGSQPMVSPWLVGAPFALAGIYGALGGGGVAQGSFGCAAGMNGGGYMNGPNGMMSPYGASGGLYGPYAMQSPWGNPYMAMNPYSGGMYMPGMNMNGMMAGPWGGMANPYMMNPYAGIVASGGIAMGGGIPMMSGGIPMMGGGMPMGIAMNGGIAMGGGYPMMAGGIPMGIAIGGGIAMNGGIAMGGGIPMMGGMAMGGGYPMMAGGIPMGIAIGGGIAMNGGIAMGAGLPMMGNVYGGMPMMGMTMGAAMMGGMPGSYGMATGSLGGMQMQQAMMQAQMQAMQSYMQTQMKQQQDAMARYRVVNELQSEMQALQMRLYNAYYGVGVDSGFSSDPYYSGRSYDSYNPYGSRGSGTYRASPSGPSGRRLGNGATSR